MDSMSAQMTRATTYRCSSRAVGAGRGQGSASWPHPRPEHHPRVLWRAWGPAPTSEGWPAPLNSRLRLIEAHVGSPTTDDHLVGRAVLWGHAVGQGWALVLLEDRVGPGLDGGPSRPPACPCFLIVPQTRSSRQPLSLCSFFLCSQHLPCGCSHLCPAHTTPLQPP